MSRIVEREQGWFRRTTRAVFLGTAVLLAALWAVVALQASQIRGHQYRALGIEAQTLARVYAESVERLIGQIDTASLVLRDQLAARGDRDLADFARLSRLLRDGPLADEVLQIAVIGADGRLLFSDLERPAAPVDLSDRAHFRAHLGARPDALFISKPVKGRVSGKWSVQLTRRIDDARGEFAGVLVLSVKPAVFSSGVSVLNAHPDGVLTLLERDLAVLSCSANLDAILGRRLRETPAEEGGGLDIPRVRPTLADGRPRMIAYWPVADRGLQAGVALGVDGAEAATRKELAGWIAWAALLSLVLLAAAAMAVRSLRLRQAAQAELADQRQHLLDAQAAAHLGSWEWDLARDALKWSEETLRIFGIAPAQFRPASDTYFAHVHPDDRARVEAAVRCTLESGATFEIEHRIVRDDGAERVLLSRGHLQGEAGEPRRMLGVVLDITERRRLEASLEEVERRWNWALEAARDGVWDWHIAEGRIYLSPRWKAILGFAPDELADVYESWQGRIHPFDLPHFTEALESYFAHQTPLFEPEYRMRAKDGSWRWILARGRVFEWGGDGRPLRMLGTHTDITARKQAELALEIERRRLVEAQAVARLGSWEWDIERGTQWWSRETYRLFGLPPDVTPTYAAFLERVHPEDRPAVEGAVADSLAGRLPYRVDHRVLRPDGVELVVEQQARVEYGDDGSPLRMVGTVRDVTASRRLERALRDANLRWRFALDGSGDGVWDRDVRSGKVFYSQRWKEMLGYRDSEIGDDGAEWRSRVHPDDLPMALAALEAHGAGRTPLYACEYRMRHRDGGYRWILARGRVVERDAEGRPLRVIGTHSDITARKEAELALADSEQRLQTLVSGMAEGVVVQQSDGLVVLCNAAAERLLRLTPAQLRGEERLESNWGAIREDGSPFPAELHPAMVSLISGCVCEGVVLGFERDGGERTWLLANSRPLFHEGDVSPHAVVTTFSDISRSKEAELAAQREEAAMRRRANYDPLTELPNRQLLDDRLQSGLARARRNGGRLAVLFIDLDEFKPVNDTLGHRAGDLVLQTLARRLQACVREDDTVARISGDEFVAILHTLADAAAADRAARAMLVAARRPVEVGEHTVSLSCSIGISVFPDHAESAAALIERADAAMYRVKQAGRNGFAYHDGEVTFTHPEEESA